jgi:hypothetical protein
VSLFATTTVPQPLAITAAVSNDVLSRTLVVRLPENAKSSYSALLWREAYAALKRDDEVGRGDLYASALGAGRLAYAIPGDLQTLKFHFEPGKTVYAQLIENPGLHAIVTIDRGTSRFLSCRFLIRP